MKRIDQALTVARWSTRHPSSIRHIPRLLHTVGKTTLSEYAAGDSYGSMYGATHNPYALNRTSGGSSGEPKLPWPSTSGSRIDHGCASRTSAS